MSLSISFLVFIYSAILWTWPVLTKQYNCRIGARVLPFATYVNLNSTCFTSRISPVLLLSLTQIPMILSLSFHSNLLVCWTDSGQPAFKPAFPYNSGWFTNMHFPAQEVIRHCKASSCSTPVSHWFCFYLASNSWTTHLKLAVLTGFVLFCFFLPFLTLDFSLEVLAGVWPALSRNN